MAHVRMNGILALSMLAVIAAGLLTVYSAVNTPDDDPEYPRALVIILGSGVVLVGFIGFVLIALTP